MKYMARSILVDAFHYIGFSSIPELEEFLSDTNYEICHKGNVIEYVDLWTPSGSIFTSVGPNSWLVKDLERKSITKLTNDVFNSRYEQVQ